MGRENTADLMLHPVRLRIIQAMLGGRRVTTAQLAEELSDVSTATLYRQIAVLVEAGLLLVVAERRVRGAVERTFELSTESTLIDADALAAMSPEEHRRGFVAFVAGMLANFDRYVERGDIDLVRDQVGYRQYALWLSDDELSEFLAAFGDVYRRYADLPPAPGRTRRILSTVVIPTVDSASN